MLAYNTFKIIKGVFNMWESLWESFREVWPKSFLTTTFLLIIFGFFYAVKVMLKDEKIGDSTKKKSTKDYHLIT